MRRQRIPTSTVPRRSSTRVSSHLRPAPWQDAIRLRVDGKMRRSLFSKLLLEISALFQGARELLEPRHKSIGASSEYWVTDIDELIVVAPWRKSLQQLFVILRKRQPELGLDFWPGDPGRDRRDTSSRANQRQVLIHEFPYSAGYIGRYDLSCFLPHTDAQGLCHSCSEQAEEAGPVGRRQRLVLIDVCHQHPQARVAHSVQSSLDTV